MLAPGVLARLGLVDCVLRHGSVGVTAQQRRGYWKHPNKDPQTFNRGASEFLHGRDDNSQFKIEGISDKSLPILLDWRRPRHVWRIEPGPDGSGDIGIFEGFTASSEHPTLPAVDLSRPLHAFRNCKELEDAPDVVRKVLSLEFGRNADILDIVKHDLVRRVQRHPLDFTSIEVAIALLTVKIRNGQKQVSGAKPDQHKFYKHLIKIKVDQRRVLLRRLRESDYKRFEWLLEKLNIVYKPRAFVWERVERKKHLTRLTELWCEEFKEHRTGEYKRTLQLQQIAHLREKAETLRWMAKEEQELGLESSVTEDQINDCLFQAAEIEKSLRTDQDSQQERHIFQPVVAEEKKILPRA